MYIDKYVVAAGAPAAVTQVVKDRYAIGLRYAYYTAMLDHVHYSITMATGDLVC
jgi:hypothetical protein